MKTNKIKIRKTYKINKNGVRQSKYKYRYCRKMYRLRPLVGINPRPARPRDTMRTECIDAYARAPAVEPSGASARGVLAGRPRGGAPPPPSWWAGKEVTRRRAFFPFSLPLIGLCHKHRYDVYVYYNIGTTRSTCSAAEPVPLFGRSRARGGGGVTLTQFKKYYTRAMTPRSRTATALHRTVHGVHLTKSAVAEVVTGGITQLYVYIQARTSAIILQQRGSFSSRNYCPSTCALTLCCCRCFSSSPFAVHAYY